MRRRIMSLLLAHIMLFSQIPYVVAKAETPKSHPSAQSTQELYSAYKTVIQNCMLACDYTNLDAITQGYCRGTLYDIDSNGQEELVLQYRDGGEMIYEIWTIENGDAACLLRDSASASGHQAIVYRSSLDETNYIVYQYISTGSSGAGTYWLFYPYPNAVSGKKYELMLQEYWDDELDSEYYINGEYSSFEDFDRIHSSIEKKEIISMETDAVPLDLLLNQIDTSETTEYVASGSCGKNVRWFLIDNGVLTICGEGNMTGWGNYKEQPWETVRDQIKSVVIEEGVTNIGGFAFSGCENLVSASLPSTLTYLSDAAFSACEKLVSISIPEGVWHIGSNAFVGCTNLVSVTIPTSVEWISAYAFKDCKLISNVYYAGSESEWNTIDIYSGNESLTRAKIHFNGFGTLDNLTGGIIDSTSAKGYELVVYSIARNLTIKTGSELQLICALYHNGELVKNWNGVSWGIVRNPAVGDIIEVSGYKEVDEGYHLRLRGLQAGKTTLTITEGNTGANITLDVTVLDKYAMPEGCIITNVPSTELDQVGDYGTQVNFYNYNGLYVTDFPAAPKSKKEKYHLSFNVYNRSYMHGSVDVYNKDGEWVGSQKINKNENVRGVVDTLYGGVIAIGEWISGRSFSFKASTFSTKTNISIDVPEGGYFVISNNIAYSPGAFLYNGIDYYLQIISSATDLAFDVVESIDIEEATIEKLLSNETVVESLPEAIANITVDASVDALEKGYVDTVSGIVEQMVDLVGDALISSTSSTLDIAEDTLVSMIPPEFSMWLDVLFGISTITDSFGQAIDMCASINKSYIILYTPESSGQLTIQGITAIPDEGALPQDAVLQAVRLPNSEIAITSDDLEGIEGYCLYDISYCSDGREVQPEGNVTIKISIPKGFDEESCVVLHQQADGHWENVNAQFKDGQAVFETEHFSLFAIAQGSLKQQDYHPNMILLWSVGSIAIVGVVVLFIMKKRRKSNP